MKRGSPVSKSIAERRRRNRKQYKKRYSEYQNQSKELQTKVAKMEIENEALKKQIHDLKPVKIEGGFSDSGETSKNKLNILQANVVRLQQCNVKLEKELKDSNEKLNMTLRNYTTESNKWKEEQEEYESQVKALNKELQMQQDDEQYFFQVLQRSKTFAGFKINAGFFDKQN